MGSAWVSSSPTGKAIAMMRQHQKKKRKNWKKLNEINYIRHGDLLVPKLLYVALYKILHSISFLFFSYSDYLHGKLMDESL